jgi:hypothetical protein
MRSLLSDLAFGARLLRRNPGFTATAVVSLALGIGVNSTIFTLFDAVLLKPLSVPEPDRLVAVASEPPYQIGSSSGPSYNTYSYPMYLALREHAGPFLELVCRGGQNLLLSHRGVGEKVRGEFVSTGFFGVFGVHPAAGRFFYRRRRQGRPRGVGNGHQPRILAEAIRRRSLHPRCRDIDQRPSSDSGGRC